MKKPTGIELIAKEREEQIEKHGHTIESDATIYDGQELAVAACALAYPHHYANGFDDFPEFWDRELIAKMVQKTYKERLIIAAALIAAEIDRLIHTEE